MRGFQSLLQDQLSGHTAVTKQPPDETGPDKNERNKTRIEKAKFWTNKDYLTSFHRGTHVQTLKKSQLESKAAK